MDLNQWRIAFTCFMLVCFLVIVWIACRPSSRHQHQKAAQAIIDDDDQLTQEKSPS